MDSKNLGVGVPERDVNNKSLESKQKQKQSVAQDKRLNVFNGLV